MKPILLLHKALHTSVAICALTAAADPIPPGAANLGYTKCVFDEAPVADDIAPGITGYYKWFNGACWSSNPASLDHYTTTDGVLTLLQKGDDATPLLAGTPRNFSDGALPTLSGSSGFYIEFDVQLSDNDPDHWPAVWVMPVEHSGGNNNPVNDIYPGDPAGFERWMEIDVDEGGFGPGLLGTVISWTGIYPNYMANFNSWNHQSAIPLDRTQIHTFGASYDPTRSRVTWWVDGVQQFFAGYPNTCVPEIAVQQHFYPILSAQTHGAKKPFSMFVSGVRAYVPDPYTDTALSTVTTWGTLRNNFTGWVGANLTTGTTALRVTQLGRMMASGNTGIHNIKLVDATTGNDVTGGSVAVDMSGGTVGEFSYAMLGTPVTLLANHSYYLVAQETNGGDLWYDQNTTVTTTAAAAVKGSVWGTNGSGLNPGGASGHGFVPLDFKYSTDTALSAVTTWGTLRNNFTGWVGANLTTGTSNIKVTQLGRMMASGNTGIHNIKLVDVTTGKDVTGGSVVVDMSGGTVGQFRYATLGTPVTLLANHSYYLVAQETNGGDLWYDQNTAVTTTAAAAVKGSVWGTNGSGLYPGGASGHGFVPLDFRYLLQPQSLFMRLIPTSFSQPFL